MIPKTDDPVVETHTVSSNFKQSLKSLTGDRFWLRFATLVPYRILCAVAVKVTGRTSSGAAHADRSIEEAVTYILSVFDKYKSASGVEHFHGKIAEIGPGDSCGVGLMFLADGCEHVDLVDRFYSRRQEQRQREIIRALVERFPRLASLQQDRDFCEESFSNLQRHYGESAAAETFFRKNKNYDFIVSCAVLEHVYDPLRALSAMVQALNPDGLLLHQIDCRDHGQFSEYFHELKFLELPPTMYSPLKWGGGPNRIRIGSYTNLLRHMPVKFNTYVTSLAGIPEVLPHAMELREIPISLLEISRKYVSGVRGDLAYPFRDMPDEELMITGFMLVAKKTISPL
jgi:SAM-dependent methyltransferase